uniref:Centromere protein T n=1 Tax=Haemonchus contortus TaxID=6289 RepID=A0A7I5EBC8_HAECO
MNAALSEVKEDQVEETVFEIRERRRRRRIPSESEVPEMQSSDECVVVRDETLLRPSTAPTNLGREALDKSRMLATIPSKGKETERKRKIEIKRTTADSFVKTKKRKEVEEAVVRTRMSALPRQHRLKDKLPIAPRRLPNKNPERPFPNDLTEQERALIHMDKGPRKGETSATSPNTAPLPRQHRLYGIIQAADRQSRSFTPKFTSPNKLIEQEHEEANRPALANEGRDQPSSIEKLPKVKPPSKEKGDQQGQIDEEFPPEAVNLEGTKMQKEGRPAAKKTTSKVQQQHMEGEQPSHKDLPKNDSESAYPDQPIEQEPMGYGRPQKESRKSEGTTTSALNKVPSSQKQHNEDAVPLADQGQAPTFKSGLSSPREGFEQETDEERKSGKVPGKKMDETSLITPIVSYLPQQHHLDGISEADYKQPQAVSPIMSSPNKLTEQEPEEEKKPGKAVGKRKDEKSLVTPAFPYMPQQHHLDVASDTDHRRPQAVSPVTSFANKLSEQEPEEEKKPGKELSKREDGSSLVTPALSYMPQQHHLDVASDADYRQPQAVSPVLSTPNRLSEQKDDEESRLREQGQRDEEKSAGISSSPKQYRKDDGPQSDHKNKSAISPELAFPNEIVQKQPVEGNSPRSERSQRAAESPSIPKSSHSLQQKHMEGEAQKVPKHLAAVGLLLAPFSMLTKHETASAAPTISPLTQQHDIEVASQRGQKQALAVSPLQSSPNKLLEQEPEKGSKPGEAFGPRKEGETPLVTPTISSLPQQHDIEAAPQKGKRQALAVSPALSSPNRLLDQEHEKETKPQGASEPRRDEKAQAAPTIPPLPQQHDIEVAPQRGQKQASAVSPRQSSPNKLLEQEPAEGSKPGEAFGPRKEGETPLVTPTTSSLPQQHDIETAPQRGKRQALAVSPLQSSPNKLLEQEPEEGSESEEAYGPRKGETPLVTPTISFLPQQHDIEAAPQRGKRQALAVSPLQSSPNKLLEQEPEEGSESEEAYGPRKGETPLVTPTISFLPQQHDIEAAPQKGKRQALAVSPLLSPPNKLLEQEPVGESKPEEGFAARKIETPLVTPTISFLPQQHDIEAAPQRGQMQALAVSPLLSSPNKLLVQEPEKETKLQETQEPRRDEKAQAAPTVPPLPQQHDIDAAPQRDRRQALAVSPVLSSPNRLLEQEPEKQTKPQRTPEPTRDEKAQAAPTIPPLPQQHDIDAAPQRDRRQALAVSPQLSSPNRLLEQEPEKETKPQGTPEPTRDEKAQAAPTVPPLPQQHDIDAAPQRDRRQALAVSPVLSSPNRLLEQEPEKDTKPQEIPEPRRDENVQGAPTVPPLPQQHDIDAAPQRDRRQALAVSPLLSSPNRMLEQEPEKQTKPQRTPEPTRDEKAQAAPTVPPLPQQHDIDAAPQRDRRQALAVSPVLSSPNRLLEQEPEKDTKPQEIPEPRRDEKARAAPTVPPLPQQHDIDAAPQRDRRQALAVSPVLSSPNRLLEQEPEKETKPQEIPEPRRDEKAQAAPTVPPLPQQHDIDAAPQRDRRQALAVSPVLSSPNRLLEQEPEKQTKPQRTPEPRRDEKAQAAPTVPPLPQQHDIDAAPQRDRRQALAVSPVLSSPNRLLEQEPEKETKPQEIPEPRRDEKARAAPTVPPLPQQHDIDAAPQRDRRQALAVSPVLSSPNRLLEQEPEKETKPQEIPEPRRDEKAQAAPTVPPLPQQHDIDAAPQRDRRQALAVSPLLSSPNRLLEQEPEKQTKPQRTPEPTRDEKAQAAPTIPPLPQQHDIDAAPQRDRRQSLAVSPLLSSPNRLLEQEPEKETKPQGTPEPRRDEKAQAAPTVPPLPQQHDIDAAPQRDRRQALAVSPLLSSPNRLLEQEPEKETKPQGTPEPRRDEKAQAAPTVPPLPQQHDIDAAPQRDRRQSLAVSPLLSSPNRLLEQEPEKETKPQGTPEPRRDEKAQAAPTVPPLPQQHDIDAAPQRDRRQALAVSPLLSSPNRLLEQEPEKETKPQGTPEPRRDEKAQAAPTIPPLPQQHDIDAAPQRDRRQALAVSPVLSSPNRLLEQEPEKQTKPQRTPEPTRDEKAQAAPTIPPLPQQHDIDAAPQRDRRQALAVSPVLSSPNRLLEQEPEKETKPQEIPEPRRDEKAQAAPTVPPLPQQHDIDAAPQRDRRQALAVSPVLSSPNRLLEQEPEKETKPQEIPEPRRDEKAQAAPTVPPLPQQHDIDAAPQRDRRQALAVSPQLSSPNRLLEQEPEKQTKPQRTPEPTRDEKAQAAPTIPPLPQQHDIDAAPQRDRRQSLAVSPLLSSPNRLLVQEPEKETKPQGTPEPRRDEKAQAAPTVPPLPQQHDIDAAPQRDRRQALAVSPVLSSPNRLLEQEPEKETKPQEIPEPRRDEKAQAAPTVPPLPQQHDIDAAPQRDRRQALAVSPLLSSPNRLLEQEPEKETKPQGTPEPRRDEKAQAAPTVPPLPQQHDIDAAPQRDRRQALAVSPVLSSPNRLLEQEPEKETKPQGTPEPRRDEKAQAAPTVPSWPQQHDIDAAPQRDRRQALAVSPVLSSPNRLLEQEPEKETKPQEIPEPRRDEKAQAAPTVPPLPQQHDIDAAPQRDRRQALAVSPLLSSPNRLLEQEPEKQTKPQRTPEPRRDEKAQAAPTVPSWPQQHDIDAAPQRDRRQASAVSALLSSPKSLLGQETEEKSPPKKTLARNVAEHSVPSAKISPPFQYTPKEGVPSWAHREAPSSSPQTFPTNVIEPEDVSRNRLSALVERKDAPSTAKETPEKQEPGVRPNKDQPVGIIGPEQKLGPQAAETPTAQARVPSPPQQNVMQGVPITVQKEVSSPSPLQTFPSNVIEPEDASRNKRSVPDQMHEPGVPLGKDQPAGIIGPEQKFGLQAAETPTAQARVPSPPQQDVMQGVPITVQKEVSSPSPLQTFPSNMIEPEDASRSKLIAPAEGKGIPFMAKETPEKEELGVPPNKDQPVGIIGPEQKHGPQAADTPTAQARVPSPSQQNLVQGVPITVQKEVPSPSPLQTFPSNMIEPEDASRSKLIAPAEGKGIPLMAKETPEKEEPGVPPNKDQPVGIIGPEQKFGPQAAETPTAQARVPSPPQQNLVQGVPITVQKEVSSPSPLQTFPSNVIEPEDASRNKRSVPDQMHEPGVPLGKDQPVGIIGPEQKFGPQAAEKPTAQARVPSTPQQDVMQGVPITVQKEVSSPSPLQTFPSNMIEPEDASRSKLIAPAEGKGIPLMVKETPEKEEPGVPPSKDQPVGIIGPEQKFGPQAAETPTAQARVPSPPQQDVMQGVPITVQKEVSSPSPLQTFPSNMIEPEDASRSKLIAPAEGKGIPFMAKETPEKEELGVPPNKDQPVGIIGPEQKFGSQAAETPTAQARVPSPPQQNLVQGVPITVQKEVSSPSPLQTFPSNMIEPEDASRSKLIAPAEGKGIPFMAKETPEKEEPGVPPNKDQPVGIIGPEQKLGPQAAETPTAQAGVSVSSTAESRARRTYNGTKGGVFA